MSEYNTYVRAINKIFEVLGKIKPNWQDPDSLNYISTIEEYRQIVIDSASTFSKSKSTPKEESSDES